MSSKSSCNRVWRLRVTSRLAASLLLAATVCAASSAAAANDAPAWMHALVNVPLPEHDAKTDAVLLYSETTVTVLSADKIRTQVRGSVQNLAS